MTTPAETPSVRSIVSSSALMAVSQAAGLLTTLVATPFVIQLLGDDGFGVWELLLVIQSLALIFCNVASGTLVWRFSACRGRGDHQEVRRLTRIASTVVLGSAIAASPLVVAFSPQIVSRLGVQGEWGSQLQTLIPIVFLLVLVLGVNQSYLALIIAYQRAGRASAYRALGGALTSIVVVGLLFLGCAAYSLPLGILAGGLCVFLLARSSAQRLAGVTSLLPLLPTKADVRLLGPFAALLLISNLTLVARDFSDKLLAAGLGGLRTVADLGLASTLAALSLQVSAVALTPFSVAIGALYANDDWPGCVRLSNKLSVFVALVAGSIAFIAMTLRSPLLTLWVGEPRPGAYPYMTILLIAGFLAITLSGVGVSVAKAIGHPGIETEYALLTLVIILSTKPFLAMVAGPAGAVASSAVGWILGSAYLAYMAVARLRLPPRILWDANRVILATLGLMLIATPRVSAALPDANSRIHAVGILLVAAPLLTALYIIAYLCVCVVLGGSPNWPSLQAHTPEKPHGYEEGGRHARAA